MRKGLFIQTFCVGESAELVQPSDNREHEANEVHKTPGFFVRFLELLGGGVAQHGILCSVRTEAQRKPPGRLAGDHRSVAALQDIRGHLPLDGAQVKQAKLFPD